MGNVIEPDAPALADIIIYSFGRAKTVSFGVGGLLTVSNENLAQRVKDENKRTGSDFSKDAITTARQLVQLLAYWRPAWLFRLYCERYIKSMIDIEPSAPNTRRALIYSPTPKYLTKMLNKLLCNFDYKKEFTHRKHIASIYNEKLVTSKYIRKHVCREFVEYVSPGYPLFVSKRDDLYRNLQAEGVDTGRFFSYNVGTDYSGDSFPNSDKIAKEILLLPNHQNISVLAAEVVADKVNAWVNSLQ